MPNQKKTIFSLIQTIKDFQPIAARREFFKHPFQPKRPGLSIFCGVSRLIYTLLFVPAY